MAVTVSDTLIVVVVAVTVLTRSAVAGYIYPRPNVAFALPKELPNYQEGFEQKIISENVNHDTHESVVSYSVPLDDYNFLYQHRRPQSANLAVSKLVFNAKYNVPTVSIGSSDTIIKQEKDSLVITDEHINIPTTNLKSELELVTQHSNLAGNTFPTTSNSVNNIPTVLSPVSINQNRILESNSLYNNAQAINLPIMDLPFPIHAQSNLQFTTPQLNINAGVSSNLDGITGILNAKSPKITKHIYFHVPPPEIEEPVVKTTTPIQQKKIYKIIFIKVPSPETKFPLPLREEAYNQVAPIEDKTIIYVLSKKSEPQQVLLPKVAPSEHEVLFVKYSGNPGIAAAQINGDLQLPESGSYPASGLESGLVNGKR